MSQRFVDNDGRLNWRRIGYHARSAFAVALSLAILVGGSLFVYGKAHDAYVSWRTSEDYIGDGKDPVKVSIPAGATITQIGDILVEHNVIKATKTFRQEAGKNAEAAAKLQAGSYNLKTELPAAKALEMLLDPKSRVVIKVTLPEGRTLGEQWTLITKQVGIPREKLKEAASHAAEFGLPDYAKNRVEGFMFPDTYQVSEPVDPVALMKRQVAQFNKVAKDVSLVGRAQELGTDPYSAVIVASIVEREAARPEDRDKIAAVVYNRLKTNKNLELDSTIHYAVGAQGRVTTTAKDRAVDSPYNTYTHAGLPPGPIANPGKAALTAAVNPADVTFIYFTAVDLDTGETRYANTPEEHAANVKLFQQWCQSHKGRCT